MRCAVSRVGSLARERCGFAAMTNTRQPRTWVRVVNGLAALTLAVAVLGAYWPMVRLFDLSHADLQYQGEWIGGHSKRITVVTPGGVADRAGLKAGDVLLFDPSRDADWILANYRNMPQGFSGSLPVRHVDGTKSVVMLTPERVSYLPHPSDRLVWLLRLIAHTFQLVIVVLIVWARPCLMTWSLLLGCFGALPVRPWAVYFLAFEAGPGSNWALSAMAALTGSTAALVVFALSFPRDTLPAGAWWKRAGMAALVVAVIVYIGTVTSFAPFERDPYSRSTDLIFTAFAYAVVLISIAALAWTYRSSEAREQARLKWVFLGLSVTWVGMLLSLVPLLAAASLLRSPPPPVHWLVSLSMGIVFPVTLGYAVLRQRIFDVQFAISRTLVFGVVSTIVLVFLAVLHWLLGRVIEHSGLAFGLEGIAAIGLGLVLHRASHAINQLVDRALFRKHHQAEERLRRVTAALPFASDERAIAEALVTEPVRNLSLASAALFYRESPEGPLRRVLAQGWDDAHVESLDADSLLVRYLQAEHKALRLNDSQLLPEALPDGAALPVLAIPIVNQHVLAAVVLYGAHVNHTLLDPDEIELLHALAKAAATSHSQVRIAMLQRENAALSRKTEGLEREKETQQKMIERFEVLVRTRMTGAGEGT